MGANALALPLTAHLDIGFTAGRTVDRRTGLTCRTGRNVESGEAAVQAVDQALGQPAVSAQFGRL